MKSNIFVLFYLLNSMFPDGMFGNELKSAKFAALEIGDNETHYSFTSFIDLNKIQCCSNCLMHDNCSGIAVKMEFLVNGTARICHLRPLIISSEHQEIAIDQNTEILRKVDYTLKAKLTTHEVTTTLTTHDSSVSITTDVGDMNEITTVPLTTVSMTTMPLTTVPLTTSPEFSTRSTSGIIVDLVEGMIKQCAADSTEDAMLITHDGIYFYDEFTDLTIGACEFEPDVTNVFSGFTDLPDVRTWNAVMNFDLIYIDVYAAGNVYRWQIDDSVLKKEMNYPKSYNSHIQDIQSRPSPPTVIPTSLLCGLNRRDLTKRMVYFYNYNDAKFYIYSDQLPYEIMIAKNTQGTTDQSGNELNPFIVIPDYPIAMAYDNTVTQYFFITSDNTVYKMNILGQVMEAGKLVLS